MTQEGRMGGVGVGVKRERVYVYIELIHVAVQQKLKVIVEQLYPNF